MDNMIKKFLIVVCIASVCTPVSAYSASILVEMENFDAYQNLSLDFIHSQAGDGCTGGYYLDGFDYEGEWVEYEINVTDYGYYAIQLRARGYVADNLFEVTLTGHPSGETQTTYIPWAGIGKG